MWRPSDHPYARKRGPRPALLGLGALAAVAVLIVGCSGSSKDAGPTPKRSTTTTVGKGSVALTVTVAGVESAGQPASVPDDVKTAISTSVNDYVQAATVRPLQSGVPAGDISALFTAGAGAHLATDLPVFVDSGMPEATGPVIAKTATVLLTGLAQQDSSVVLVNAGLALDVGAKTKGGEESIQRTADLTFANDNGTWKISSYHVSVNRAAPGDTPSTTTAVSTP